MSIPIANQILGNTLMSVRYLPVKHTTEEFESGNPNVTGGCQAVRLFCSRSTLGITWHSRERNNDSDEAFEIDFYDCEAPVLWFENLEVDATGQSPWKECIGLPITGVSTLGWTGVPQAVVIEFGTVKVYISVGYSGERPRIGDGDDLLIYSEDEWIQANLDYPVWQPLRTFQTKAN